MNMDRLATMRRGVFYSACCVFLGAIGCRDTAAPPHLPRDLGTKEQYRVRVGESLGRMRVASIAMKAITFTIEEFGYSRTETLALVDPKKESSQ